MTSTATVRSVTVETRPVPHLVEPSAYFDPDAARPTRASMLRDALPVDALDQMFAYYRA